MKEDITISQKSRQEKSQDRNGKNKRLINTYLNEQHHRIKPTNLCRSKISLLKNRAPAKEHKNLKPEWEIRRETQMRKLRQQAKMLRPKKNARICWDEQDDTIRTNDRIRGDKSEGTGERRKTK